MNCSGARDLLTAAGLDDLSPAAGAGLEAHLRECPTCRREQELCRLAMEPLCAGDGASDDVLERVLAAGRRELAARSRWRWWRATLGVATAAAAAALILWLPGRARREEPPPPAAADWCFVCGDSGNRRHVEISNPPAPRRVIWERSVRTTAGSYKPLVWNGLIIINAAPERTTFRGGGRLIAFSTATGEKKWERCFSAGDFAKGKGFPDRCISGGSLYLADGERCLVLNASTGDTLRAVDPPGEALGWSCVITHGPLLLGRSADGRCFFAIEKRSGRSKWSRALNEGAGAPALAGGDLFLVTRSGDLACLDAGSGKPRWHREGLLPGGISRVHASDDLVLAVSENDLVLAARPGDGSTVWTRRVPGAFRSGLALGARRAYLLAGSLALELSDGSTTWRHGNVDGLCSAPTLAGEMLLAASGPEMGDLSAMTRSGRVHFSLPQAGRRVCDGPVVGAGRVYTAGGGKLRAMGPAKG